MRTRTIAVAWIALVAVFAIGLSFLNVPRLYRLVAHGGQTIGRVTQKICENHNGVDYEYVVQGKLYRDGDIMVVDCRDLHVGQHVSVFFDRMDPKNSSLGNPVAELENEAISILMVCLVFPPLIIFGVIRFFRKGGRTRKHE
ncbi:MAG TPA: hypothetical protein VN932_09425 [Rhizomicrobium sp.]|nr:hypothetical protein [Rhizomicrobium sp.]